MRPDIDAGPIGRKCSASNGPSPVAAGRGGWPACAGAADERLRAEAAGEHEGERDETEVLHGWNSTSETVGSARR